MNKLMFAIYFLVMPVLSGGLVTAVLSFRDYQTNWLIAAAVIGMVLAVPVSWFVTRELMGSQKRG